MFDIMHRRAAHLSETAQSTYLGSIVDMVGMSTAAVQRFHLTSVIWHRSIAVESGAAGPRGLLMDTSETLEAGVVASQRMSVSALLARV